jgi:flagellar biosynthesis chaperone FliJ
MAESLGLRRDGERLGLSPFSSEIRRRLWWHFLTRDSRAGEDYGLQNKTSPLLESEACLPLNVDDTDLYPSMKQLPQNKPGWTSMTFSLVNIDLAKTMQELATMAATSPPTRTPSESRREQVIDQLRTRIEWRLEHCNPVIPQQRLTLFCSRWLLRKLDFITRLQWALSQQQQQQHQPSASTTAADGGRLRDHLTTERNLVEALDILEPRLAGEDDLLKQFAWARRAYPQYHVTLYILWHLCVNHDETPSVARAWRAMETLFSSKDHWDDLASPGFGPKSAVLTALRAKAVALRNKGQNQRHPSTSDNDSVLNPETGPSAMATMTASVPESAPSYPLPPPLEDMDGFGGDFGAFDFDIASDEWPNWETLAQGFQPDGQGQQQTWTSPGASWR